MLYFPDVSQLSFFVLWFSVMYLYLSLPEAPIPGDRFKVSLLARDVSPFQGHRLALVSLVFL